MSLSDIERKDLVKYRIEKAKETFAEISVQIENNFFRTAANRMYYACYYAATALLIKEGYETHSHKGVISLLGLHFIKENRIDKYLGNIYGKLFFLRLRGDYEDWVSIDEDEVTQLLKPAEKFIITIENLINEK